MIVDNFTGFSLNLKGRLYCYDRPQIMGILNVTPDSFYASSRTPEPAQIAHRIEQLIDEGADMIDIGAYSSRPGADDVTEAEEIARLERGMRILRSINNSIPVSVDTFRASVARAAIESMGVDIVNDISGGNLDAEMFATVAALRVPYILMHMRGTPSTMQSMTEYNDVTSDVISALSQKLATLEDMGVNDVIVDPGFGFSKTVGQNYELLRNLLQFNKVLSRPVLVGVSRKSMFTRPLGITPAEALEATTAANTIALLNGASILRVHDVAAARHALAIVNLTLNPSAPS